jgi:hypothetical protein
VQKGSQKKKKRAKKKQSESITVYLLTPQIVFRSQLTMRSQRLKILRRHAFLPLSSVRLLVVIDPIERKKRDMFGFFHSKRWVCFLDHSSDGFRGALLLLFFFCFFFVSIARRLDIEASKGQFWFLNHRTSIDRDRPNAPMVSFALIAIDCRTRPGPAGVP